MIFPIATGLAPTAKLPGRIVRISTRRNSLRFSSGPAVRLSSPDPGSFKKPILAFRMGKAKILLVDDEQSILNLVEAYLRPEGYEVQTATDGDAALTKARAFKPDIIVLDIMLPVKDGIEVLTTLRRESNVYVIMLTAKTEETDRVVGLSVGADDYLTKPFSPRELVARIKAALRRMQQLVPEGGKVLAFEHLRVDAGSRQVWVDDKSIDLTAIEFDLLKVLALHRGQVLSREQLLEMVWGGEYFGDIRVVDVHLGHLRQKLGDRSLIQTVRGIGYRFDEEK
jgi:two-component system alkaline phosphatase synthesis response regulator PhoP